MIEMTSHDFKIVPISAVCLFWPAEFLRINNVKAGATGNPAGSANATVEMTSSVGCGAATSAAAARVHALSTKLVVHDGVFCDLFIVHRANMPSRQSQFL